jgi:hypothetical protein
MMTPLADLTSLIRSKNAGPFSLTFDIMFADQASYWRVKKSGVLTKALFAEMYHAPAERVKFFECDNALAFKFSIPRAHPSGDLGDGDLHGGQQFAPLLQIQIP